MSRNLRILYTADLHGNLRHYQKLLSLSVIEKADSIVMGGDLLPKGQLLHVHIEGQRRFITDHLRPLFESFRDIYHEKAIYLMMGNDDYAVNMNRFEEMETEGTIKLLHLRVHPLTDSLSLAGYGCVPPTSFLIKDWERLDGDRSSVPEHSYQACSSEHGRIVPIDAREWFISHNTISEDLETLARLSEPANTIYVMHTPPLGTKLDVLRSGRHAGSRSVRHFIEERRPPLTLHGHVHESHNMTKEFIDRIGSTICVNAGQTEDFLHAVIVDLPGYVVRRV
ncbi:MAG TPA: metallophosphoesterase [Deltaproteobacteria bacterium]|nr:metallophosphoesterase [Deltaproteobacteria bacterium]